MPRLSTIFCFFFLLWDILIQPYHYRLDSPTPLLGLPCTEWGHVFIVREEGAPMLEQVPVGISLFLGIFNPRPPRGIMIPVVVVVAVPASRP